MKKIFKGLAIVLITLFICLNIVVAFHAYKFTHFYDKNTTVVKKPELMSGWEETEAILFGVSYSKLPLSNHPAHRFQKFYTKTTDDIVLEGWYIPQAPSKGTVILFHGHGGNRGSILTEANSFYSLGYNVCMVDFRAHGDSQGNVCTIGYNESADVKAAYDYVTSKGETNIILWGISLGAATITKAMTDYKDIHPAKVILEMPFGSLTDAVKGKLRIMHLPLQPLTTLLTFWGAVEQGFWTFSHKPSEYAKNIHVPVLLQWGKNDLRVTEAETEEIFHNLPLRKKQLVIYNKSGHESLAAKEPAKWNAAVKAFLEN
ncbi:MAG: alpha/beta fold hydrolase [Segetibacter sp.]|nr:alpha/beta fold hydrolase [Segetibacter sp.]